MSCTIPFYKFVQLFKKGTNYIRGSNSFNRIWTSRSIFYGGSIFSLSPANSSFCYFIQSMVERVILLGFSELGEGLSWMGVFAILTVDMLSQLLVWLSWLIYNIYIGDLSDVGLWIVTIPWGIKWWHRLFICHPKKYFVWLISQW